MTKNEAAEHGRQWADHLWSEGARPSELETDIRQCWRATCKHECIEGTQETWQAFQRAFRAQWDTLQYPNGRDEC